MISLIPGLIFTQTAQAGEFGALFGYTEVQQKSLKAFPQWQAILNGRDIHEAEADCPANSRDSTCDVKNWISFLDTLQGQTRGEQLNKVNEYVNEYRYVGDQSNYGREDHWALPGEFMENGGDCEDFAIMKFFSLLRLGWAAENLRLVVVQDTKRKQQHAVLAVDSGEQVLILDNQTKNIKPQRTIAHYAPVVSMSDQQWWLHLPDSKLIAAR